MLWSRVQKISDDVYRDCSKDQLDNTRRVKLKTPKRNCIGYNNDTSNHWTRNLPEIRLSSDKSAIASLKTPDFSSASTTAPISTDRGTIDLLFPLLSNECTANRVTPETTNGYFKHLLNELEPAGSGWREKLGSLVFNCRYASRWLQRKIPFEWDYALKIVGSILGWYCSSIALTMFNKIIWTQMPNARNLTASLIALQSVVMSFVILVLAFLGRVDLSFATFRNIAFAFLPMATLASMDIACTNSAYSYITVSMVVVIKSAIPCLTYICGALVGLNTICCKKITSLLWIILTVSFTLKEMEVDSSKYEGIILTVLAVIASAIRWTLTQVFIKPNSKCRFRSNQGIPDVLSPIQLISIQQPLILLSLLPVVAAQLLNWSTPTSEPLTRRLEATTTFERGVTGNNELSPNYTMDETKWFILYALVSSTLAFAVVASELYIIKYTDSTTLTVGGIGKEIVVLLCSAFFLKDTINLRTCISISLTLLGITCYAVIDYKEKHSDEVSVISEGSDDHPIHITIDDSPISRISMVECGDMSPRSTQFTWLADSGGMTTKDQSPDLEQYRDPVSSPRLNETAEALGYNGI